MYGYGFGGYPQAGQTASGYDSSGQASQWGSQAQAAYAMAAYGYGGAMAAYGYGGAYGYGSMGQVPSTGSGSPASFSTGRSSSQAGNEGKKGDYSNLLSEMKEKQEKKAAAAAAKEQKADLEGQLRDCCSSDFERAAAIQYKLSEVEQELWMMGESASEDFYGPQHAFLSAGVFGTAAAFSSSSAFGSAAASREEYRKFRPPEDGSTDQFGRLCHAIAAFLRTCSGLSCELSRAEEERRVKQEWDDLISSGLVTRKTKLRDVLIFRPHLFEMKNGCDAEDGSGTSVTMLRLLGEADCTGPNGGLRSQREECRKGSSALDVRGSGLRPEQVTSIEAYVRKAGGSERVSRLCTLFDLDETQLSRHFTLYEDRGRSYATITLPSSSSAGATDSASAASSASLGAAATAELEKRLRRLERPTQSEVQDAMVFCLDAGAQHAAVLARSLVRALNEPELKTDALVARLFLVSDVLYNSRSEAPGAGRFRTSFQELLPDAFKSLGQAVLRSDRFGKLERARAEAVIRRVLAVWQEWEVFAPLFTKGLESLVFAPMAAEPAKTAKTDDAALKPKLARWCSAKNAARLPYAARVRGLSGSALATAQCRARLCHFERYWHAQGDEDLQKLDADFLPPQLTDEDEDMDGDSLSEGDLDPSLDVNMQSSVAGPAPSQGRPVSIFEYALQT